MKFYKNFFPRYCKDGAQRQTNGDAITVDSQKPMLDNSIVRDRIAWLCLNDVNCTDNNQPWKLKPTELGYPRFPRTYVSTSVATW